MTLARNAAVVDDDKKKIIAAKAEALRNIVEKAIVRGRLTDVEIAEDNDTTIEYVQQVRTEMQ